MSSEMLGQQALPRVGHRWVKRATIAAVILLALCLFLVGLNCLVAGPTGGCAVIVGRAAIVTSAFLVSVVVVSARGLSITTHASQYCCTSSYGIDRRRCHRDHPAQD